VLQASPAAANVMLSYHSLDAKVSNITCAGVGLPVVIDAGVHYGA